MDRKIEKTVHEILSPLATDLKEVAKGEKSINDVLLKAKRIILKNFPRSKVEIYRNDEGFWAISMDGIELFDINITKGAR